MPKKLPFSKKDYFKMLDDIPTPAAERNQTAVEKLRDAVKSQQRVLPTKGINK